MPAQFQRQTAFRVGEGVHQLGPAQAGVGGPGVVGQQLPCPSVLWI
ncbi:hypothetical protein ACFU3O_24620 [Streptomyces antibioticus]